MEEAGQGHASCFCAKDKLKTAVMKVRVSEVKGEGTFREDMFNCVRCD